MSSPRFLTLPEVAEVLNTSTAQVYALVRRKDLPAMKLGGRGQWRVQVADLETFIERQYAETEKFIDAHPFEGPEETDESAVSPAEETASPAAPDVHDG